MELYSPDFACGRSPRSTDITFPMGSPGPTEGSQTRAMGRAQDMKRWRPLRVATAASSSRDRFTWRSLHEEETAVSSDGGLLRPHGDADIACKCLYSFITKRDATVTA
jgi:hypothetical protein